MPTSTFRDLCDSLLHHTQAPPRASFDIPTVDAAIGSVAPGELVLVGGHPGAPVDGLLLRAALAHARRGELTVLVAPSVRRGAVAAWLLSTTGLPLDVIWERRVPDSVASELARSLAALPIKIADGMGGGVEAVRAELEASPSAACVVVLNVRWLDVRTDPRMLLTDLKRLGRDRGVTVFAGIDTRFPGPQAVHAGPRPDLFPDSSLIALGDVVLLLSAPWVYEAPGDEHDTFSLAVVAPAERRAFVSGLRSPRRTMQVIAPDPDPDDAPG